MADGLHSQATSIVSGAPCELSLFPATATAPIEAGSGAAAVGGAAGGRGGLLEFCLRRSEEKPLPTADAAELVNRWVMLYDELSGDVREGGDEEPFAPPFESRAPAAPPAPPAPSEEECRLPDTLAFRPALGLLPSTCKRVAMAISDSTVTSAFAFE